MIYKNKTNRKLQQTLHKKSLTNHWVFGIPTAITNSQHNPSIYCPQVKLSGCYASTARTRSWCGISVPTTTRSFTPCSCDITRKWAFPRARSTLPRWVLLIEHSFLDLSCPCAIENVKKDVFLDEELIRIIQDDTFQDKLNHYQAMYIYFHTRGKFVCCIYYIELVIEARLLSSNQ